MQPFLILLWHLCKGKTAGGTEGGHQEFIVGIGLGEGFLPESAVGLVPTSLFDVGDRSGATVEERKAVGTRTQAEVGGAVPVATIVLRLKAGTGVVADLVLTESSLQKLLTQSMVLLYHFLLVRQHYPTLLHLYGQCGARLHGEGIGGDMGNQLKIEG